MAPKKFLIIVGLAVLAGLGAGLVYLAHYKSKSQTEQKAEILHYSYFSRPDFFDSAYKAAKPQDYQPEVKAIIVNHHLLAVSFIAEGFDKIATTAPVTVVLVSPNHFGAGRSNVITSTGRWQTPYGVLEPDTATEKKLSEEHLANIEEDPFIQEHGVSGIVAFIKKSLPNAKIVPVIFRDRMTLVQAQQTADDIYQLLPKNSLIVGSFDFSHYLPSRAADFHDLENLSAIESFDFDSLYHLDIDSRPGLAFFLRLLKDQGAQNFHLLEHSNSAKLAGKDILETTSYITGYFTSGSPSTASAETLLSLGNIEAGPDVLSAIQKNNPGYALEYLERLFQGQDKTLAFLETGGAQTELLLKKLGISSAVQDNGDYQLGKIKVKILDCGKGKKGEERAKRAVDEGEDAVICQGAVENFIQFYKNKAVIYAAGNFLDENGIKNGKNSLAVGLAYQNNQLRIFLFPVGSGGGKLKLLIGGESDKMLAGIAANSSVSEELRSQIKTGVIRIDPFDFAQGKQN